MSANIPLWWLLILTIVVLLIVPTSSRNLHTSAADGASADTNAELPSSDDTWYASTGIFCPTHCVCQRVHLRDSSIGRWTGGSDAARTVAAWHLSDAPTAAHNHNEVSPVNYITTILLLRRKSFRSDMSSTTHETTHKEIRPIQVSMCGFVFVNLKYASLVGEQAMNETNIKITVRATIAIRSPTTMTTTAATTATSTTATMPTRC